MNARGCAGRIMKSKSIRGRQAKALVDGSYNERKGLAGFGVYLRVPNKVHELYGYVDRPGDSSKNILGEVTAALIAIKYAIKEHCSKITIVHDCKGIEKWATGEWKRNIPLTQAYHEDVNELMKSIDVSFQHVKAHSGDENNNRADKLAKQGCGLK